MKNTTSKIVESIGSMALGITVGMLFVAIWTPVGHFGARVWATSTLAFLITMFIAILEED